MATQLTFTLGMAVLASYNAKIGHFFLKPEVAIISLCVLIFSICALMADEENRKSVPFNYVLLLLVTLAESCSVCAFTAKLEPTSVLICIGVLSVTLLLLTCGALYARESRELQNALVTSTVAAGLIQLFCLPFLLLTFYGKEYQWIWVMFAVIGTIVTGGYVIVDLLMIMDAAMVAADEYILAAFMLYVDVVRLFIYILMLLGKDKE